MKRQQGHHYIYQEKDWPSFRWDNEGILGLLAEVRLLQGRLFGKMESLGFSLRQEANLGILTEDVVKSSEIEGEILPVDQVRSSAARKLGLQVGGLINANRKVDGVVALMVDATTQYSKKLTKRRLLSWHEMLFPTAYNKPEKVRVGEFRDDANGPMEVISGAYGKRRIHFVAPKAQQLEIEMKSFLDWFNKEDQLDPVIKAAVAHLWFVTIHPFDDGNGRIARAIADMQLSRSDKTHQRFYSMSSQICRDRKEYYEILEKTQRGNMDITPWVMWFLHCLKRALESSTGHLNAVLKKASFWEKHRYVNINDRQRAIINRMMDDFFGKLSTSKYARMMKVSQDTAHRDIAKLIDFGMLEKEPGGGRSTRYRLLL